MAGRPVIFPVIKTIIYPGDRRQFKRRQSFKLLRRDLIPIDTKTEFSRKFIAFTESRILFFQDFFHFFFKSYAALYARGEGSWTARRDQAYLGVMVEIIPI